MMANIWPVYRTVRAVQYKSTGVHRPGPASPPHQTPPSKPAQPPLNTPPQDCQNSNRGKGENYMHVVCTRSHKKKFSTSFRNMSCTKYVTTELEAWNWPAVFTCLVCQWSVPSKVWPSPADLWLSEQGVLPLLVVFSRETTLPLDTFFFKLKV